MALYSSVEELVGNTPMIRISSFDIPQSVRLYAKLELCNPGGSVKDRVGLAMVKDAEERGVLYPGAHIVEATAGNTGIGLAFAAVRRGYKVTCVVPEKFSVEKQALMRALGARVINTPGEEGVRGAITEASRILTTDENAVSLGQFTNQANPRIHEETTGVEIARDVENIDVFVAGAGSGGTFSGVARYLKRVNPQLRCVLADPIGSIVGGGTHAPYAIEGIGNDFIAETMDMNLVDDVVKVSDVDAIATVRELARREGIVAGSSSGAALWAAVQVARTLNDGTIVTIFPDRGDRYFSTHLLDANA